MCVCVCRFQQLKLMPCPVGLHYNMDQSGLNLSTTTFIIVMATNKKNKMEGKKSSKCSDTFGTMIKLKQWLIW